MNISNGKARGLISLIPVVALVAMLALSINIFGSDAILGASQVALLVAAGLAVWLSMWLFKTPWKAFEDAIKGNIGDVTTAIVILLLRNQNHQPEVLPSHRLPALCTDLRNDRQFVDNDCHHRRGTDRNRQGRRLQRRSYRRCNHLRSLLRG